MVRAGGTSLLLFLTASPPATGAVSDTRKGPSCSQPQVPGQCCCVLRRSPLRLSEETEVEVSHVSAVRVLKFHLACSGAPRRRGTS